MKALTFLLWALLPSFLLTHASQTLSQTVCDAPEAQLKNNYIQIEPTGLDDTANIQCALDLAVERNIPEIRLTRGDFYISTLSARAFVGTLQGGGKDHTRVRLLERSIACSTASAAITFAGGEPRVRWLSLIWDRYLSPCGSPPLTLLQFTTLGDNPSSCSSDVIVATVDRVALEGPGMGPYGWWEDGTAVRVEPARDGSDCRNALLGSFRLNRSIISRFPYGVEIRMRGGATVGIHKNSFVDNAVGVAVRDSGATVMVAENYFATANYEPRTICAFTGRGMIVDNSEAYQQVTRLDVYANTFEVENSDFCGAVGLHLNKAPGAADASVAVSGNKFLLVGEETTLGTPGAAIFAQGVSGAVVKDNQFTELMSATDLPTLIQVEAALMDGVTGWTIDSNNGFAEIENLADIFLGENVRGTLIGPAQGAVVIDYGFDNTVLPQ